MRGLAAYIVLTILSSCFFGCAANRTLVMISSEKLDISANIAPIFIKFAPGKVKLEGEITVSNKTSCPLRYGNKLLLLKVNDDLTSRAYMDTIASVDIDFTTVVIKPHSKINFPAYWVYSVPTDTVITTMKFIFTGTEVCINERDWLAPLPEKGLLNIHKSSKETL